MKLKEKFENAPVYYDNDLNSTIDYVSIADDFAIGFAEWVLCNRRLLPMNELLEVYKKEKEL